MTPTVAIVERRPEFAAALQEVVVLARCTPVIVEDFHDLTQLQSSPAAIVVRITMNAPSASPLHPLNDVIGGSRPKVFALASTDADVAEAERLGCDVVLREPQQIRALSDALKGVAGPDAERLKAMRS